MKLVSRVALGVDISETFISMALLKKDSTGVKLLKTASGPVPDGAIENGNVKDAAALSRAIRSLKNRITIRTTSAAVSLFSKPVIVQIMDMPRQVPSNIGQFVQDQVKHLAVLPGSKIALDFCGVSGGGSEAGPASRLLTVATDGQKVTELIKLCGQAGIVVDAIEPPVLAYARALYAEKIAEKFDCNVLIAVLRDNSLTLCVFRRQNIDFIRTKDISEEKPGTDELSPWLVAEQINRQINTIIQFYDVEVPDSCGKWEITVVADSAQLPENAAEVLAANVAGANLQLISSEDISHTPIVNQSGKFANGRRTDKPSLVAVGLAMKLLDKKAANLGVNLLPAERVRLKAAQRRVLITANIIAVILLIMILAVNGPTWKIKKLHKSIDHKRASLLQDMQTLVEKRVLEDEQISTITQKLNKIEKVLGSRHEVYWPALLSDIARRTPKTVCITGFSSGAGSSMFLEGLAISNEAVYLFVDMLNESGYIESASIFETEKDDSKNGLVRYEIGCSLAERREI